MKIAIIQGAFLPVPPLRGGAVEKLWHRLGIEFARQGHEVVHISRRYPGLPDDGLADGVRHLRVSGYDQPSGGLRLKLLDLRYTLRAARRVPPSDIVVTNTFWAPLLVRHRGRICVSVERMPKGQMRLYRRAARLVACSSAVREAILAEVPGAGPRVCVIPNPLPEVPSGSVDWAQKEQQLLYVGRIHPEKGIELLLDAFARVRAAGGLAGWKLEVVGPWEERDGGGGRTWARKLQARRQHPDVVWVGPLFRPDELATHYRRARVFVYPSLAERGETFGLAALEAMSWGTVPIVSALACFRDFVISGHNGIIFDHRGPDAVDNLAGALAALPGRPLETMSHEALGVRTSHAPTRIAALLLREFAATLESAAGRT